MPLGYPVFKNPRLLARAAAVALVATLCPAGWSRPDVDIVRDYAADTTGRTDAAPAFRRACRDVAAGGGGAIHIPAGTYKFESTDPHDPASHVLITQPSITFDGAALGTPISIYTAQNERGCIIESATPDKAIFKLARGLDLATWTQPCTPSYITFRNLRLSRLPTATEGGYGIAFDSVSPNNNLADIEHTVLDNVAVARQFDGIRTLRNLTTRNGGRPNGLDLRSCFITRNVRHGMYLTDWLNVSASGSMFTYNGQNGVYLLNYINGPDGYGSGTASFSTSGWFNNMACGLQLEGVEIPVQDIQIASCQIDHNARFGVSSYNVKNLNISGSSITANGYGEGTPAAYRHGAYIDRSLEVSISGVTFKGNFGAGASINNASALSMSGCVFSYNNNAPNGREYALVVNGGQELSFGTLSFFGSDSGQPQTYGVWVGNNPRELTMQGFAFPRTMTVRWASANITQATGSIRFEGRTDAESRTFRLPEFPPR